ncbi:MAG: T9SS type A sorting domain-containing protein, partial [Sphingobacteriales bacterium]
PIVDDFTFCTGATVADLNVEEASVTWYATQGGNPLAETDLLTAGTYYVTQTLNACESPATPVEVTINALPAAPSGAATQTFTAGQTVADLEVTTLEGATVIWYVESDVDGYTVIPTTTVLEDGVTYYVSQTTNGCGSAYFGITANVVAGTHTFTKANLKVYPNPANDQINISIEKPEQIASLSDINVSGREVAKVKRVERITSINTMILAAGNYFIKLVDKENKQGTYSFTRQ